MALFPVNFAKPESFVEVADEGPPYAGKLRLDSNTWQEIAAPGRAVNDLIRKAREIEGIRARLVQAEQSGFTPLIRGQIRAEIREAMQRNGEVQD